MNKIYRVVWNETTQTWNAVAEFAKAHGKTASSGIGGIVASVGVRFAFTAIMSGLLLASGQVMAAANNGKTLANGKAVTAAAEGTDYNTCYFDTTSYNVVCGDDTTTALDFIPQDGGPTFKTKVNLSPSDKGTQTSGESNVAIGPNSATAETGSIAIGSSANASQKPNYCHRSKVRQRKVRQTLRLVKARVQAPVLQTDETSLSVKMQYKTAQIAIT